MSLFTSEQENLIKEYYNKTNGVRALVSLIPDKTEQQIRSKIAILGLRITPILHKNNNYFNNINNTSCYIAGILAGCGHLTTNKTTGVISIGLTRDAKDRDFLERIKNILNYNGNITSRTIKKSFSINGKTYPTKEYSTLRLDCSHAEQWQKDIGSNWNFWKTSEKTQKYLTLEPPIRLTNINHKLSYLAGLIDSDGSISLVKKKNNLKPRIFLKGTLSILQWVNDINNYFFPNKNISNINSDYLPNKGKIYFGESRAYWLSKIILSLNIPLLDRHWSIMKDYTDSVELGNINQTLKRNLFDDFTDQIKEYFTLNNISIPNFIKNEPIWTDEQINIIKENHGKLTLTNIHKLLKEKDPSYNREYYILRNFTQRLGLFRDKTENHLSSKNTHNTEYFNTLNPYNCYVAGLILTDGCISEGGVKNNSYTYRQGCAIKDECIIDFLIKELNFQGSSKQYVNQPSPHYPDRINKHVSIQISCFQQNYSNLNKYFNIVPNKTFRLKAPNFSDQFLNLCTVIGAIDGDGTVGLTKFSGDNNNEYIYPYISLSSVSKEFIEWFYNTIETTFSHLMQKEGKRPKIDFYKRDNMWRYGIYGSKAAVIIDYLRQLPTPKLARKWNNPQVISKIEEIKQNSKFSNLFMAAPVIPVEFSNYKSIYLKNNNITNNNLISQTPPNPL